MRVARRDRWRDLVGGEVEGRVEGRDRGDDADREAHQERHLARAHRAAVERHVPSLDADRFLGGERERFERAADLRLGILDRLAGLARQQLREALDVALDQTRRRAAAARRARSPASRPPCRVPRQRQPSAASRSPSTRPARCRRRRRDTDRGSRPFARTRASPAGQRLRGNRTENGCLATSFMTT